MMPTAPVIVPASLSLSAKAITPKIIPMMPNHQQKKNDIPDTHTEIIPNVKQVALWSSVFLLNLS